MTMMVDGPGMPARMLREWAKEETLAAVDSYWLTEGLPDDAEERAAVLRERDRVAKFLGLGHLPNPLRSSQSPRSET